MRSKNWVARRIVQGSPDSATMRPASTARAGGALVRTSAIIYGVTAFRNAVGGALAAVALAALAACSSSGGGGQASTPTLYDKYGKPLTQRQDEIHTACLQMISQECVNDIEQLKSMMNDIRVDVGKASASGKFTRLLASIDQVDKDYQLFKDKNCGTGNINYNCNVLAASTIVRDAVTVNGNLASTD
jgi:hypothetical protein